MESNHFESFVIHLNYKNTNHTQWLPCNHHTSERKTRSRITGVSQIPASVHRQSCTPFASSSVQRDLRRSRPISLKSRVRDGFAGVRPWKQDKPYTSVCVRGISAALFQCRVHERAIVFRQKWSFFPDIMCTVIARLYGITMTSACTRKSEERHQNPLQSLSVFILFFFPSVPLHLYRSLFLFISTTIKTSEILIKEIRLSIYIPSREPLLTHTTMEIPRLHNPKFPFLLPRAIRCPRRYGFYPLQRHTVTNIAISALVGKLSQYACTQTTVQRYASMKSLAHAYAWVTFLSLLCFPCWYLLSVSDDRFCVSGGCHLTLQSSDDTDQVIFNFAFPSSPGLYSSWFPSSFCWSLSPW